MNGSLIRDVKHYCKDFEPIRNELRNLNAIHISKEKQVDFIFHLIDETTGKKTKRLKIRYENDLPKCAYTYNRDEKKINVKYDCFKLVNSKLKDIMLSLFQVSVIVRKKRETWQKDDMIFHLDSVEGLGNIFEIEFKNARSQRLYHNTCKSLFQPLLLEEIKVSNEDLLINKKFGYEETKRNVSSK